MPPRTLWDFFPNTFPLHSFQISTGALLILIPLCWEAPLIECAFKWPVIWVGHLLSHPCALSLCIKFDIWMATRRQGWSPGCGLGAAVQAAGLARGRPTFLFAGRFAVTPSSTDMDKKMLGAVSWLYKNRIVSAFSRLFGKEIVALPSFCSETYVPKEQTLKSWVVVRRPGSGGSFWFRGSGDPGDGGCHPQSQVPSSGPPSVEAFLLFLPLKKIS